MAITDFDAAGEELERETFEAAGLDVELDRHAARSADDLLSFAAEADALLVQFAPIDERVLAQLSRCRIISRYGIGVDMIDVQAATAHGIPVANVPDFCIDEVSTQTIGFVIDLARHTFELAQHVREGGWGARALPTRPPARLLGQTLGVIGLGKIGRAVAAKAHGLGLSVIAADPYIAAGTLPDVVRTDVDTLLATADFVSLHCPLTESTRGLIGAEQLAAMKPTAYLINMARGPVVDQAALVAALRTGTIAGAALDVLDTEPPSPDDPLLRLANVIITPHTSSWSAESMRELRRGAAGNVAEVLLGRRPASVLNPLAFGRQQATT